MAMAHKQGRTPIGAELVNFLLGLWVALSPFILGFTRAEAKWNDVAIGIALLVVVLLSRGHEAFGGLAVLLATWLFWCPFILGFNTTAFLASNVTTAFVVIGAAISSDVLRRPPVPVVGGDRGRTSEVGMRTLRK